MSSGTGRGVNSASVFQNTSRSPEYKFIDNTNLLAPALAGTGQLTPVLNNCAQGTDAVQHIGRRTALKSLYWMVNGFLPSTTTGGGSFRLVIVYDKEAEGAAPTIATGVQTDIFNQDNILAQMNLNNRDRFIVLLDEIIESCGTAGPQAFMRKGYRKLDLPCVFNSGNAGTIADINTGSVYGISWFSPAAFVTTKPTVNLQTRIRFTDE